MSSIQANYSKDFGEIDYCFHIIENPFNIYSENDKVDYNLINNLDLNIVNFRKYYPEIRELLKNNDACHEDIYYDFVEIQTMSNYIYDDIEEKMKRKDIEKYLDYIFKSLRFVSNILMEFHNILHIKIDYIYNKISRQEYDEKYENFQMHYKRNHEHFYKTFYKSKERKNVKLIKEIWTTELI